MRTAHPPERQAIYDLGNDMERIVLRELEFEMGIEILQRGRDYLDPVLQLSGHMDALIGVAPAEGPPIRGPRSICVAEIKGLNPNTAERVRTLADIRENRASWVRKYYWQLQAYLMLSARPLGLFVLKNKSTGEIRFVACPADYGAAADIRAKALRLKAAVATGEPPARHVTGECERCPFLAVCGPDWDFGPGVAVLDDAELVALLETREENAAARAVYEDADDEAKAALRMIMVDRDEALVGPFVVRKRAHGKGTRLDISRRR